MRILIVDDDRIVLESCRRILEAEGITAHTAENAETARAVLETEGPFDVIMTDIKMPGSDGFELIRPIRKTYPEMAILMMTGYLIPETIRKGTESGADLLIAKPFTPEELLASVHDAVAAVRFRTE
ncbi:response regulator [Desulfococcus sp.]|uniref:response regulator n=1 Tax=Desulfococcus sp. TaxID=2025834 RepID=UPI003593EDFB